MKRDINHIDCITCNSPNIVMVEYDWTNPQHYDGVSEYSCLNCGTRRGRWSGKILGLNEYEDKNLRFKPIEDRKDKE